MYLREGYPSLFVYCRDALGLSEAEAYTRIEVARAARRFPVILQMLAAGALYLTGVRLLAPHLTPTNHREVLASARGKRKREIEEIVARLSPRPDAPTSIRRVPTPLLEVSPPMASASLPASPLMGPDPTPVPEASPVLARAPMPRAAVTPLSPDRYKLQLTIGRDTLDKLQLAKDMLSHGIPNGDDAAILDRALDALLVDLAKKRFAHTLRPRRSDTKDPRSRQASAADKRMIWVRDRGRCKFVGPSGHRCNERRFLQFHHLDPYALGGETSADNIELRCRAHNDYEGRLYFGRRRRNGSLVHEAGAVSDTGLGRKQSVSCASEPLAKPDLFRNKSASSGSRRRPPVTT